MQRARVLVVDDDPGIRLMLVTCLRSRGLELTQARNGREALAEMRAGHPELVLLDLAMPIVSGLEVLRERAADRKLRRIPVIVITANRSCDVAADILGMGVYAVIAKPFDLHTLLETVTSCLAQPNVPTLAAA